MAEGIVTRRAGDFDSVAGRGLALAPENPRYISMPGGCFNGRRSAVSRGRVNVNTTVLPDCSAERSSIAVGTGGLRSIGSPGEAQPLRKSKRTKIKNRNARLDLTAPRGGVGGGRSANFPISIFEFGSRSMEKRKGKMARRLRTRASQSSRVPFPFSIFDFLQDVAAQVVVFDNVRELFLNVGRVHFYSFLLHFRRFEGDFLQDFFEDGVQAARSDVFGVLVDRRGEARHGGDGVVAERELEPFGVQQRRILLDERVLG